MERIIFHIDVNSAYLSWSAVEKRRLDPESVNCDWSSDVCSSDLPEKVSFSGYRAGQPSPVSTVQ